jgi:hypothetical protein
MSLNDIVKLCLDGKNEAICNNVRFWEQLIKDHYHRDSTWRDPRAEYLHLRNEDRLQQAENRELLELTFKPFQGMSSEDVNIFYVANMLEKMEVSDLINFCRTSTGTFRRVCDSPRVWEVLIERRYHRKPRTSDPRKEYIDSMDQPLMPIDYYGDVYQPPTSEFDRM